MGPVSIVVTDTGGGLVKLNGDIEVNVGEAQADLEVTLSQSQILLRIRFFTTMTLVSKTSEEHSIPMTLPDASPPDFWAKVLTIRFLR